MKRLLLLLLVVLLAWCAGAAFNLRVSPDTRWLLDLVQIKADALKKSQNAPQRILVVGGSSVLFGVDAVLLQKETGRSSINLGLAANLGALFMLGYAEDSAKSGDLVVLSIEPDLFDSAPAATRDAANFTASLGKRQWMFGGDPGYITMSPAETLGSWFSVTTPGLRRIVNYTARRGMHLPLFRYRGKRVDEFGYAVEKVTFEHPLASGQPVVAMHPGWKPILRQFRERMQAKGVEVVYRLPWCEVAPEHLAEVRQQLATFQANISEVLPVLAEPDFGLKTDRALFSDFMLHLSTRGGKENTQSLAYLIPPLHKK
ncbi:MAG: hypothetical protein ABIT76_14095 [Chthoniobacterales bacterium]